ncbi:MAG: DUF2240 family protein [Methanomassiliicoccales archaeon]
MDELRNCLALVFKRKGKGILSERELVFSVSMDFRWFTPKEAQRLLDLGLRNGLLERVDDMIKPTFDYKKIEISINFKPDKKILEERKKNDSVFSKILDKIVTSGVSKRDAVAKINKIQEKIGVDAEVAAVAYAKEIGVSVDDLIDEVEKEIIER